MVGQGRFTFCETDPTSGESNFFEKRRNVGVRVFCGLVDVYFVLCCLYLALEFAKYELESSHSREILQQGNPGLPQTRS